MSLRKLHFIYSAGKLVYGYLLEPFSALNESTGAFSAAKSVPNESRGAFGNVCFQFGSDDIFEFSNFRRYSRNNFDFTMKQLVAL